MCDLPTINFYSVGYFDKYRYEQRQKEKQAVDRKGSSIIAGVDGRKARGLHSSI